METLNPVAPFRVGQWLPSDQKILDNWISDLLQEVEAKEEPLLPVIKDLKELIERDAEVFMLFHQMFTQVPHRFKHNPAGGPQIKNYHVMLRMFNAIMTKAPEYNNTGLVGFPFNAILDYSMGTEAGFAAFLNDKVNKALKNMLNEWGIYLRSADSRYVLNTDPQTGWFGQEAMNNPGFKDFDLKFKCDPQAPYHGYQSWDDFFTREFREGVRPVADPDNDAVICNACESAPYRIATNVKQRDTFWIKAQPYSLQHMMHDDPYTKFFVGGTVYQAFLSALSYHRWHAPVSGKVMKAYVVDGTYYSETPAEGYDQSGPNESQGYITEVATRALIYIQADNQQIGLMCFMAVGMAEVSSCDITVYEGQHVEKGDQLGMFHFGGSTHCLFFGPQVQLEFDLHKNKKPGLDAVNIDVRAKIATVGPVKG